MRKAKEIHSSKRKAQILYTQGKKTEAEEMWRKAAKDYVEWKARKRKESLAKKGKI